MDQEADATQAGLALQSGDEVIAELHSLERGSQNELTWMQHERLFVADLDQRRQGVLRCFGIDVRIEVVLEYPEETIHPQIDAGWLDKRLVVRIVCPAIQHRSAGGSFLPGIREPPLSVHRSQSTAGRLDDAGRGRRRRAVHAASR